MKKPTSQREKSQAERYVSMRPELPERPAPLRQDKLGRLVFNDGSFAVTNMVGEMVTGAYELAEWFAQETSAYHLGVADRVGRKKIRREFKAATAKYPRRICRAYRLGFFSVPQW